MSCAGASTAGGPRQAADLYARLVACWGDSPAGPEAPDWGEELLSRADDLGPGPRARLELAVVHAQFAFELIAAKLPLATRALAHAEAAGDEFAAAAARLQMAIGLGWKGVDMDRAAALLDRARTAMTDLGERHWAAVALEFQGLLALRRLDVVAGIAVLESAAAEHRETGGPGEVAHALMFIGYARRAIGDLSGALRAFDEARRLVSRTRVSTWLRATVGAGHAALALGDTAGAGASFRLAHDRAVEVGDRRIAGTALVGLASIARRAADDPRCVALLRAAAAEALAGGDPTDAVTAAGMLAEMLVERDAVEEAAVLLGAAAVVPDEVAVRVDFGLAYDGGPVRSAVAERLGAERTADLAGDGRVIGSGGPGAAGRRPAAGPGDRGRPGGPAAAGRGGHGGPDRRGAPRPGRGSGAASTLTPPRSGCRGDGPWAVTAPTGVPWATTRPRAPPMASTVRPAGIGRAGTVGGARPAVTDVVHDR